MVQLVLIGYSYKLSKELIYHFMLYGFLKKRRISLAQSINLLPLPNMLFSTRTSSGSINPFLEK